MTEKKTVYIASPYSGNVDENIEFARAACRYFMERDYLPFAPHLIYPQILDDSDPAERQKGLDMGLDWVARCDEFAACGDEISSGMSGEVLRALQLNKPIQYVSREQILGEQAFEVTEPTTYAIWAKGRPERLLAGQAGFLCKNRKRLSFSSRDEAEVCMGDVMRLCLNNQPVADFKCVEYPKEYASDRYMHLETIKELDMIPTFDPANHMVKSKIYDNTGGHCMVGTVEFYLPDLDRSVWVNCNNEGVTITSADYSWNEDDSGSWERYDDVALYVADFDQTLPDDVQSWLPMIHEALQYTIEQETAYFSESYSFPLPVAWLPESIRQDADPEYLSWMQTEGKAIHITAGNRIVIDESYLQNTQNQYDLGTMEPQ